MNVADFLEKWGRTLFESPISTSPKQDEPPELAEIRLAVLDRIREKSYRSGGKKVFPFDLLRVEMRGVEVRSALRDGGCRFPDNLRVDIQPIAGLPKPGEDWLIVETASQDRVDAAAKPIGKLIVHSGEANAAEIRLDKTRTNIGRVVDVYRAEGLFRRNDLAFEADTEINRSVSREHAHIRYDRNTNEYRLFNDRWYERTANGGCGTWIVRDGMSQEVHRTARGTKLEAGDEIRFGRAVVMFEME